MSTHVLLNFLNELGKRDKMRGLPSILCLFRNELNKFNNTNARMVDYIYHMTLTFFRNLISMEAYRYPPNSFITAYIKRSGYEYIILGVIIR